MSTIKVTLLSGGFSSSTAEEVELEWNEDLLEGILAIREVKGKEVAPCLVPALFKGGSNRTTRSGRRAVADAEAVSVLIYDLDDGDLDQHVVERACDRLNVAYAMWSTWQAGDTKGMRWRILFPLASPVDRKTYEDLWARWARAVERGIAQQCGSRRDGGWVSWGARACTQPAILPARPMAGSTGSRAYPWGGREPRVVLVDAALLDAGTAVPARAEKVVFGSGARPLVAYVAHPDSQAGIDAAHAFTAGREAVQPVLASLDAVARLRRDGISGGGRHNSISACIWNVWRSGAEPSEWAQVADEVVAATKSSTDRKYVEKAAVRLVTYHDKRAAMVEPHARQLVEAAGNVPRPQQPALRRYARVLARALHLRTDRGGQLDHDAIARVCGIDVKVVTAWRQRMVDAGLMLQEGEKQGRVYRVLIPLPTGVSPLDATQSATENIDRMIHTDDEEVAHGAR